MLILMKPHGTMMGPLGHYFDLNMELKFNETSEISFSYPQFVEGRATPFFDDLTPGKLLQIDPFGVFVLAKVQENQEGTRCVREVTAYSREYEFAGKQVVFAAGTYNFWNPADVENTVMGILLSYARNWKMGTVSSSLIGRYRTFDDTDTKALDFMLGTLQETYGCVFVFDTYNRVINVIDADEDTVMVPVYLSPQNLINEATVETSADNIITRMAVYGADGVSIRNVNPTGDNYLYNLDYSISIGDLPDALAAKWRAWQNEIFAKQPLYTSLTALRNSARSRLVVENAHLIDLQGELFTLDNTCATFLQMQMEAQLDETYEYFAQRLAETAVEYAEIEAKIDAQKALIAEIQADYDAHAAQIAEINGQLKLTAYFTTDELDVLDHYFATDSYTDDTFAVFDIDVTGNDDYTAEDAVTLQFSPVTANGTVVKEFHAADIPCDGGHRMVSMSGGVIAITGNDYTLTANMISGILDHNDGQAVCSLYLGSGTVNGTAFPSGSLSCVFDTSYDDDALFAGMTKHENTITNADGTVSHTMYYYTGSAAISGAGAKIYFTRNASEYQRYTVEQELYDYATTVLEDAASPTYEFDIESGNLLFEKHFEPFRDAIQLGCGVYLQLNDQMMLKPLLLEIHLNYEDPDDFELIFSNQFKRPDAVNTMKDMVTEVASMARQLDTNRYRFGENDNTTTWVKSLLETGYDAAMAQIMAGAEGLVTLNQAGLTVDSADGAARIYLNNGMIALYDTRTNTVNMAMGRFYNEATGTDFVGVLADIIGGTLLAGQNLIIECPDPNGGVMQFKVDSSGVIINGGRFYIRNEKGAFGIDGNYGLMLGTTDLFETTDTGFVTPTCIDPTSGSMLFDDDNWPKNVNVWMGIDGTVYIRGNIYATDGVFNGTVYAKDGEFRGAVYATSGIFKGTVQASTYLDSSGKSMMTNGQWNPEYLNIKGLTVEAAQVTGTLSANQVNLTGAITWSDLASDAQTKVTNAQTAASNAQTAASTAQTTANNAASTASSAYSVASSARNLVSGWQYGSTTYIDGTMLMTGTVRASSLQGGSISILRSNGAEAGIITVSSASSSDDAIALTSYGALRFMASSGDVYLQCSSGANLHLRAIGVVCNMPFMSSNVSSLGLDTNPWSVVYARTPEINTSDRNLKHDIESLPDKYLDMLLSLTPRRYKLNDGTSDRYHVGFIAQEVEEAMDRYGIDSLEFGGFVKDKDADGNDIYMLRYSEFMAIHTLAIQNIYQRLEKAGL